MGHVIFLMFTEVLKVLMASGLARCGDKLAVLPMAKFISFEQKSYFNSACRMTCKKLK